VVHDDADSVFARLGGPRAESTNLSLGILGPGYSSARFVQMIGTAVLRVLVDRYNHIVVLGASGALVCTLFVAGKEVAARLPDGTCWGSRRLIGGEPTPGAAERIATALEAAERGEGRSP
jgi:hypothetical protein